MKKSQPQPQPLVPPTDWNDVADWYDQLVGEAGSEFHRHVVFPRLLKLLSPASGENALDVACGQGVLCRAFASLGLNVTGIDAAGELINTARKRGPESIRYLAGDARELNFVPENRYDLAACVLAIQNIHPIGGVFAGVSRALKMGGRFAVVMMHPCFRGPKETSWGWEENKVQYRRVDRYLIPRKVPIVAHPGKKDGAYTWTFHKPIEAYLKAARNAGLYADSIEEWASHKKSTSGPRAHAENVAREEIPMFMAMRFVKLSIPTSSPDTTEEVSG